LRMLLLLPPLLWPSASTMYDDVRWC
jgi:hypothetical protein